jgi:hypothetical protein
MEILIVGLIALNVMLGIGVFVAYMRRMDEGYARSVREREDYFAHFRPGARPRDRH